ncbi:MFS general substrate transporter [Xylariaceae sp. FL0255]|nr:MFS general substrate transporter [Xylariaceae sp. FL0255]
MSLTAVEVEPSTFHQGPSRPCLDVDDIPTPWSMTSADRDNIFFATARPTTPEDSQRQEFSLPPVDGGKDAWLFLAAAFVVEALAWGFPFPFGVFEDYYRSHPPFEGQQNIVSVGTTAMGVMYLAAPIIVGGCRFFGAWARWTPIVGLSIMTLALGLSSLSTKVVHLIVTQGSFYGIGGGIAYCPCILYMDEWFVKKNGLAYGIMWSATGVAGVVVPLLMTWLFNTIGFRDTLRLWAGLLFVLTTPLAFFIKPRLPPSATSQIRPFDLKFLGSAAFLLYEVANIIESSGFFLPGIYLPTYARNTLGAGSLSAATTVLLVNIASVFGCIAMGWVIDRLHVTTCILLSTIGATIGSLVIWGLSPTLPLLYLFCIVYGFFAGSFSSTWPGIMMYMSRKGQESSSGFIDPSMVFGFLAAGRDIGNVVAGPLSESLLSGSSWKGDTLAFGYGSGYGSLIVFTGVTALIGGSTFLWRRLGFL